MKKLPTADRFFDFCVLGFADSGFIGAGGYFSECTRLTMRFWYET